MREILLNAFRILLNYIIDYNLHLNFVHLAHTQVKLSILSALFDRKYTIATATPILHQEERDPKRSRRIR